MLQHTQGPDRGGGADPARPAAEVVGSPGGQRPAGTPGVAAARPQGSGAGSAGTPGGVTPRPAGPAAGRAAPLFLNASLLAWLHIPKTGTSLGNVALTHACSDLPGNKVITAFNEFKDKLVPFMGSIADRCRGLNLLCGHHKLTYRRNSCNSWPRSRGHFIGMFRQPEQRTMSAWFDNKHSASNKSLSLPEFARAIRGCQVRMLTDASCSPFGPPTQPSKVGEAIRTLDEGFAFVGLTEEWELSVCLFHAMFGGSCHSREFMNVRPSRRPTKKQKGQYNLGALKGWKDDLDGPLYAHAVSIFRANLEKYQVGWESCRGAVCTGFPQAFSEGYTQRLLNWSLEPSR